jgi:hypothetical protein
MAVYDDSGHMSIQIIATACNVKTLGFQISAFFVPVAVIVVSTARSGVERTFSRRAPSAKSCKGKMPTSAVSSGVAIHLLFFSSHVSQTECENKRHGKTSTTNYGHL